MAEHVVKYYDDEADLVRSGAVFVHQAIERGDVAVVIATDDHRRSLETELACLGTDVAEAIRLGRLLSVDAEPVLAGCSIEEGVDPAAFQRVVGEVVGEATSSGRPVLVYGDMVVSLWDAGEVPAAIELERLWAELRADLPFTLYCAYPSRLADGATGSVILQRIYDFQRAAVASAVPGQDGAAAEIRATAEFGSSWSAPGTARRWARSVLGHWSLASDELLDDASLVVTELANNAVLHAGSTFTLNVRTELDLVRLSVRDDSLSMPVVGAPGLLDRFGRGLGIVAALATSWGVDADDEGKVVWAQLGGAQIA